MKSISLNRLIQGNFWVVIALLPLGQLTRLQLTPIVAISLLDLASLSLFGLCILHRLMQRSRLPLPPFFFWIVSFIGISLLSLLINQPMFGWPGTIKSGLYLARWLNHALLFPVVFYLYQVKLLTRNLKSILLWVTLTIAGLGIAQYVFLPDTRFLAQFGWDDHLNRLISTMLDPGFTSLFFVFGLILLSTDKTKSQAWQVALLLISLALTYARSGFLVFILISLLSLWLVKSKAAVAKQLTIFFCLLVLLPRTAGEGVKLERTASIESRAESAQSGWEIFTRKPILGYGFNSYAQVFKAGSISIVPDHANAPDNSYLLLLTTTGIIGTAVFLYWQLRLLRWSFRSSPTILLTTLAIILHSFTNNTLFHPFIEVYFWILLGSQLASNSNLDTRPD